MDKIYLIYNDSEDDMAEIYGAIVGTEEQAKQYCEEFNAKCDDSCREVRYKELVVLNEQPEEEMGEWIEGGNWLLFCSNCDREIEDKDTDEYPAFCPWCGKPMKKEVRRS